jgi:hypothetical protein
MKIENKPFGFGGKRNCVIFKAQQQQYTKTTDDFDSGPKRTRFDGFLRSQQNQNFRARQKKNPLNARLNAKIFG